MSVRLQRETTEAARIVRAAAQQAAVEAEASLPGGLRDEVRLFYTEAQAVPLSAEAAGNRLTVNGRVTFRALYAQGDLTHVRSVEEMRDFSRQLPLPQPDAGAQYTAACEVGEVSARVFNGRLLMRAEVNVSAAGLETREVSLVTGVQEEDAQTLAETLPVQRAVGGGGAQGLCRGEFDVAAALQAQQALLGSGEARVEDILGGEDGRATVTGVIDLAVCLASSLPGRPLVTVQHSLPFEQQVALTGEAGDLLSASARVTDVAVALEDAEGTQTLRAEVGLDVQALSIAERQAAPLRDVFGSGKRQLSAVGERMTFCVGHVNEQAAESGRLQLTLPSDAPRIKTVLAAFVQPALAGAKAENGRMQADMTLRATLIYMTEDSGIPVAFTAEEPARMTFTGEMREDDLLRLSASRVEASAVAGDRAEIRYVMTLHAGGTRETAAFAVTDVTEGEVPPEHSALSVYSAQGDETLWDVMKRYRLSREGLLALNPEIAELGTDAPLPAGTKVIAYKR
ncbi:MAG: DUF3794 domain-containing protein [Clostridia bacterium]|nr:DUF3794 domain-containing protein [Clostridia bacterium]